MSSIQNVALEIGLTPESFEQRKAFIGLRSNDLKNLLLINKVLLPINEVILDEFYKHLLKFEYNSKIISSEAVLFSLKSYQSRYFKELTQGVYDFDYALNRLRVGVAHERVGLTPSWYIGAYSIYLSLCKEKLSCIIENDKLNSISCSLDKIALLDITLAFDAYMYASHLEIEKAKNHAEDKYSNQNALLKSIIDLQHGFIKGLSQKESLEILLKGLVELTNSQVGLILTLQNHNSNDIKFKVASSYSKEKSASEIINAFVEDIDLLYHQLLCNSGFIEHFEINKFNDKIEVTASNFLVDRKATGIIALLRKKDSNLIHSNSDFIKPVASSIEAIFDAHRTREALSEVKTENDRLSLVTKDTINGVVVADINNKINLVNPGLSKITGLQENTIKGLTLHELVQLVVSSNLDATFILEKINNNAHFEADVSANKNKEHHWIRVNGNPILDRENIKVGYILFFLDITDEKIKSNSLHQLKYTLDQLLDAVFIFDPYTLDFTYINQGALRQLGYSYTELMRLKPYEIKKGYDKAKFESMILPLINGDEDFLVFEAVHLCKNGQYKPVEVFMQFVKGEENNRGCFINIMRDISERYHFEHERRQSEERLLNLFKISHDPMAIIGEQGYFIDCNQASLDLFGVSSTEDILGKFPIDLSPPYQSCGTRSKDLVDNYINDTWSKGYQRFEWLHHRSDGNQLNVEVTLTPISRNGSNVIQVIWRDLTHIKLKDNRLKYLAYYDELTNLPNKNFFSYYFDDLKKASNSTGRSIAFMYIDIVNTREVNDTLGHSFGDDVIRAFSNKLLNATDSKNLFLNESLMMSRYDDSIKRDTPNIHSEFIARISGDEFAYAILFSEKKEIDEKIKFINSVFSKPIKVGSINLKIKTRVGISKYPDDASDFIDLLAKADIALQLAKKDSESFVYYQPLFGNQLQKKAVLARKLEAALISKEGLELRFQPQVSLNDYKLSGAEVLIRWYDNDYGWVSPSTFIPIAEERGLIDDLTSWVLKTSMRCRRKWEENSLILPGKVQIKFAINISARELKNDMFIKKIINLLEEECVSASSFELELTETGLMTDPEKSINILHSLKDMGFALAIDDFGTGHSSLTYLKDINADLLKIDMSFVKDMKHQDSHKTIVETIISTAHIFGMKTLAEGIEDEETARILSELGCDYGQGYFFSKPLSIEEFENRWLYKF